MEFKSSRELSLANRQSQAQKQNTKREGFFFFFLSPLILALGLSRVSMSPLRSGQYVFKEADTSEPQCGTHLLWKCDACKKTHFLARKGTKYKQRMSSRSFWDPLWNSGWMRARPAACCFPAKQAHSLFIYFSLLSSVLADKRGESSALSSQLHFFF